MPTDEQILALMRASGGMERGLQLLMNKYQAPLYRQLMRMTGNHDDTADLLQNCFIKAYRHIGQFEGKSKLSSWLYRIAANEAITFLHHRQPQGNRLYAGTRTLERLPASRYTHRRRGDSGTVAISDKHPARKAEIGILTEVLRRNALRRNVENTGHIGGGAQSLLPPRSKKN